MCRLRVVSSGTTDSRQHEPITNSGQGRVWEKTLQSEQRDRETHSVGFDVELLAEEV